MSDWAFMRRFTLRDRTTGREYLRRRRAIQTPWFSIFVHRLEVPDPGEDLHDHPWPFVSLILRGGYTEVVDEARDATNHAWVSARTGVTLAAPRRWGAWSVHTVRLDQVHRIVRLDRSPTWTLVVTGRRCREWGFYTPSGFVAADEYDHPTLRALDELEGRR